eukprot:scaffold150785_cov29-Prasinocladus_malaysianus.AAC.4
MPDHVRQDPSDSLARVGSDTSSLAVRVRSDSQVPHKSMLKTWAQHHPFLFGAIAELVDNSYDKNASEVEIKCARPSPKCCMEWVHLRVSTQIVAGIFATKHPSRCCLQKNGFMAACLCMPFQFLSQHDRRNALFASQGVDYPGQANVHRGGRRRRDECGRAETHAEVGAQARPVEQREARQAWHGLQAGLHAHRKERHRHIETGGRRGRWPCEPGSVNA